MHHTWNAFVDLHYSVLRSSLHHCCQSGLAGWTAAMALHRPAASSGNSRRDTPGGSARKELLLVPHAFHSLSFASSASSAHVPHALFHHASSGCHANGFHGSSTLCSEWRPVERMSQSQISRTICSVAQARHMPSTSWLSRCCSLLTCSHLKSMDPSLLADTLVALTQLDYHPGELPIVHRYSLTWLVTAFPQTAWAVCRWMGHNITCLPLQLLQSSQTLQPDMIWYTFGSFLSLFAWTVCSAQFCVAASSIPRLHSSYSEH